MNTHVVTSPSWSTASFGDAADTLPLDLSALGEHLVLCRRSRGRLFALHCVAQSMHGFVAARFVTTVVVMSLVISLVSMVF